MCKVSADISLNCSVRYSDRKQCFIWLRWSCILTTVAIKIVLESNFRVEMCELPSCDGEKQTYINIKLLLFFPHEEQKRWLHVIRKLQALFVCVCFSIFFLIFYLTEASFLFRKWLQVVWSFLRKWPFLCWIY